MESLSVGSFADLLFEVSNCKYWDLYLCESSKLMALFFEPTMVFGLMCQNQPFDSELVPSVVAYIALMIQDCFVFD